VKKTKSSPGPARKRRITKASRPGAGLVLEAKGDIAPRPALSLVTDCVASSRRQQRWPGTSL